MSSNSASTNERQPTEPGYALLFDTKSMRRHAVELLLGDWLDYHRLTLVELDDAAWVEDRMPRDQRYRIAIFSIGGEALAGSTLSIVREVGQRLQDVPRAILADDASLSKVIVALKSGVRGYISTGIEPDEAKRVLTFVLEGGAYFPPTSILDVASAGERPDEGGGNGNGEEPARGHPFLTERQNEVLQCIRQGKSNKVIARDLLLRESTVKVHVRQILRRLGAENRTQAALRAAQLGPSTLNGELHGADERDAVWG